MKKLPVILLLSITLFISIYYFWVNANTEIITTKTLTINNCTVNYGHYKHDNRAKMAETGGHAVNNIMELGRAKIEIAKCLCDVYLTKKNVRDSIEIIHILNSEEYTYSKNIFEYALENFQTDTLRLEFACKNKQKYFGRMMLD